jgi:Ca-activated chloride channel family protein
VALFAGAAGALEVVLRSPTGREPIFGPTDITAEVRGSEPVSEVQFFVDGSLVARLRRPPFTVRFDVGQSNIAHHFVVEATTLFGGAVSAEVTTPTVSADEQVDVELVQLFVSVESSDGGGRSGFRIEDLKVVDDTGEQLPITTFAPDTVPISGVVLLDSSDSMKGEAFARAVAGAKASVQMLGEEDEVMIALFSDHLLRATDFTRDPESLRMSLSGVEAHGGSAVYDHLYMALNRLRSELGRPVVILFSDGEDVSSLIEAEQIRWRARRSQATLFWIRMAPEGGERRRYMTFWRDGAETDAEFETLEATVIESGGWVVSIRTVDEAQAALSEIFRSLRAQFVVGFQPSDRRHDGSWRPLSVSAGRPGVKIRARAGYFDQ